MRNNYASLPLWLHEGLAEYYSTFEVAKDEARIGLPVADARRSGCGSHPLIPLATLFTVNERSAGVQRGLPPRRVLRRVLGPRSTT